MVPGHVRAVAAGRVGVAGDGALLNALLERLGIGGEDVVQDLVVLDDAALEVGVEAVRAAVDDGDVHAATVVAEIPTGCGCAPP